MRIRRVTKHALQAIAEGSIIALLIVGLMAGTTFAAKGGGHNAGGGGGSVTLDVLGAADGLAHFGQQITFTVSTTASEPGVKLTCSVNGVEVYNAWGGFWTGSLWGTQYVLGPTPSWSSGAADCVAKLQTYASKGMITLATTSFHVYE